MKFNEIYENIINEGVREKILKSLKLLWVLLIVL